MTGPHIIQCTRGMGCLHPPMVKIGIIIFLINYYNAIQQNLSRLRVRLKMQQAGSSLVYKIFVRKQVSLVNRCLIR